MHNDKTFFIGHAQRDPPDLLIVFAVINARQNLAVENLGGVDDVDTTFPNDLPTLAFVPFEFHLTYSHYYVFGDRTG